MALVTTDAVILHSFKYGESSKIVRLATAELGVQSAIAKGATRAKSRFGARLQVLSEGVAQIYVKQNRDLQTLAEFDVVKQRRELAHDVRRYAGGAALAELVLRFSHSGPNPELFALLVRDLDNITSASPEILDIVVLSALWGAVCVLGFAPALDSCARDGARLSDGAAVFSVTDGGFLCSTCSRGVSTRRLSGDDRLNLLALVAGRLDEVGTITARHGAAHSRLLRDFVQHHVSEGRELKALAFWEDLVWTATS
ncbi:MAG: DNA repair protein RecO [Gemmatimonadales bacterium]